MFASIAGEYDLLNHLLSLNIDRLWRRFTTRTVPPEPGVPVLDCCTGTADLALAYHRAGGGRSPVIGSDFCHEMLRLGNEQGPRGGGVGSRGADRGGHAAAAVAGRHVRRRDRGVRAPQRERHGPGIDEMIRVARPGGKVAILEFSRPRGPVLGRLYLVFFRRILPRIGQALAPNGPGAYHYLPTSVLQFPDGQAMLDLLAARGLTDAARSIRSRSGSPRSTSGPSRDGGRADERTASDLVLAMTGASGAPYAVALLHALCRSGRTVHLTISGSGAQVLREELGIEVSLKRFDPSVFGDLGEGRVVYHHHDDFSAGIASGSFLTGGMVVAPCSMSTLASIAHGITDEPDHPRGRRPPQGASQADPRAAGDPAEPDPPGEHG